MCAADEALRDANWVATEQDQKERTVWITSAFLSRQSECFYVLSCFCPIELLFPDIKMTREYLLVVVLEAYLI